MLIKAKPVLRNACDQLEIWFSEPIIDAIGLQAFLPTDQLIFLTAD